MSNDQKLKTLSSYAIDYDDEFSVSISYQQDLNFLMLLDVFGNKVAIANLKEAIDEASLYLFDDTVMKKFVIRDDGSHLESPSDEGATTVSEYHKHNLKLLRKIKRDLELLGNYYYIHRLEKNVEIFLVAVSEARYNIFHPDDGEELTQHNRTVPELNEMRINLQKWYVDDRKAKERQRREPLESATDSGSNSES
jgi:hypothetical protein